MPFDALHRLPKPYRDQLQSIYNIHMLRSIPADPFKLALFRLMGKLDPSKRSIALVTSTTEDWLWFQFAMVLYYLLSSHFVMIYLFQQA